VVHVWTSGNRGGSVAKFAFGPDMQHITRWARALFSLQIAMGIELCNGTSETASRVRLAFAAAHPEAAMFRSLVRAFYPQAP
jgi:hypothetical protein